MEEFKMGNYNNFGQALAAGRVGEIWRRSI